MMSLYYVTGNILPDSQVPNRSQFVILLIFYDLWLDSQSIKEEYISGSCMFWQWRKFTFSGGGGAKPPSDFRQNSQISDIPSFAL
jgi:hypothetical protein